MKEQLVNILKYVIAPVFYLALAFYILKTIWKRSRMEDEEDDIIDQ